MWLVNGYSELEGRVELHQDGQQFAVCCPFSPTTANMICKRLGFSSEGTHIGIGVWGGGMHGSHNLQA